MRIMYTAFLHVTYADCAHHINGLDWLRCSDEPSLSKDKGRVKLREIQQNLSHNASKYSAISSCRRVIVSRTCVTRLLAYETG